MSNDRHIIWSNYALDYEDWRDDLEVYYPYLSEEERIQVMYETNNEYLKDERANLNIQLSQPILVFADLGLWDGRVSGLGVIDSGNIRDCLYANCDYQTWYVDRHGDLYCDAVHHDGVNHYLYRAVRDGVSEEQIDRLKEKAVNRTLNRSDVTRLTRRLGDEIGAVYGWTFPTREPVRQER